MADQVADFFTVLLWNVRGLNYKFKRALLFQYLKSKSPQLFLLQETHLMGSKILTLKKAMDTKGGTRHILCTDPRDKFVLVVFTLWAQRYIIVNIYVPPSLSHAILYAVLERITLFAPGKYYLWGTLMLPCHLI